MTAQPVDLATGEILSPVTDLATGEILSPVTDLATLDPSDIDRAADPGAFIVLCLERSKTWLTEALDQGDIGSIVEMKSQAEAIRVYTMQKQLGKDSELAATEIVRRAERGIGLAIRQGQQAGEIRRRARHGDDDRNSISPSEFLTAGTPTVEVYAMTDGVTDERFEEVISEAKAEGNLSRANVARKAKGATPAPQGDRPGHLRKTRHHDANRIVEQTVLGMEGYALGIALIDFDQLDGTKVAGWSRSLSASLQSLNRLSRQLKELDQP